MQEIDSIIDEQTDFAEELVRLCIRNRQAHEELQSYHDTQTFKYIHPIAENHRYVLNQKNKLLLLLCKDPATFMNEITNTICNIRRIESNLNKEKYKDQEERLSWINNLTKARNKLEVMKNLISK